MVSGQGSQPRMEAIGHGRTVVQRAEYEKFGRGAPFGQRCNGFGHVSKGGRVTSIPHDRTLGQARRHRAGESLRCGLDAGADRLHRAASSQPDSDGGTDR